MTAEQLRPIFEKKYNRSEWYEVLKGNFNVTTLFEKPVDITHRVKSNPYDAKAWELGSFTTLDGHLVGMYEVEVKEKSDITRNRKGLRNLLSQVYSTDVEAALLVFIQGNKWRFSYVSEITVKNKETGKREKKTTDPKRYTYLLGEGERAKTAADRFARTKKSEDLFGGGVTLHALEEAFNVEKMSKAFFNEYRKQYGQFTAHITGEDENSKKIKNASPLFKTTFNGDHKAARDFVKKMMGRIVFLYFLEKKGWLGVPPWVSSPEGGGREGAWGDGDENFLSNLYNHSKDKKAFYSNVLVPLFFATLNTERKEDNFKIDDTLFTKSGYSKLKIPYLNGGLFEEDETMTQFLVFPEELFANLFTFFDQYNFTVYEDSPDEHTVAVDPEMLGHIFENLLEDNKDKGAFYTPKEIVHYMCRESLIEYLYTKLNPQTTGNNTAEELVARAAIEKLVLQHEAADIIEYDEAILKALKEVKICDPAIGSGAFPMGLLMEIFHLVETLYYASPDVTADVWKFKKGWEPAKVKEEIIQNSIYGVDIEKGAVDIARLRFWLSLVVEEETPKPLPNLDYKIVVGNSLLSKFENEVIDIDWSVNMSKGVGATKQLMKEQELKLYDLQHKQHLYFVAKGDKAKLQKEIRDIKIDVLVNQITLSRIQYDEANKVQHSAFPTEKEKKKAEEVTEKIRDYNRTIHKLEAIKNHKTEVLDFFDWKLDFPEVMNEKVAKGDAGFDIVIGNPPYVGEKGFAYIFDELKQLPKWSSYYRRRSNTYYFFIKLGLDLLRKRGLQSLIIPREFTTADWANKVRLAILESSILLEIIDFRDQKVFKEAGTSSLILTHKKANGVAYKFILKSVNNPQDFFDKTSYKLVDVGSIKSQDYKPWHFGDFKLPITDERVCLGDFFEISQGIVTGSDKVTKKHIADGLATSDLLNRGIFLLKEGIDIKINKSSIWLKINERWVELEETDKELIKPYFKTENLFKWRITKSNTYLIYIGSKTITENIKQYLLQFEGVLINRATIIEDKIITLKEFERFSVDDIKKVYSSAGAVQKIMRKKKWYLPLYEREDVPFEGSKIVVNTKNMNAFTYSKEPLYSSGGGAGGQNFIYHNKSEYFANNYPQFIDLYTQFICAILNSKLIHFYISSGEYNQLSTAKIGNLPIPKINLQSVNEKTLFESILSHINLLKIEYAKLNDNSISSSIRNLENQIDILVCKTYNLTYEEACIVEGNSEWMSKEAYEKFKIE